MLDLSLELESDQILLPVRLENVTAGIATYTNFALWDTGAEMSGVSKELADWLHLKPRQEGMYMQTASEVVPVEVAVCRLMLPSGESFEQDVMILPTNDTPVIVGFDIIKQGLFSIGPEDGHLHFHYELIETRNSGL